MTDHQTTDSDPVLDRHTELLRTTPVPDGPSPETLAATLAMLDGSPATQRHGVRASRQFFWESLIMLFRQPLVRTAFVAVLCTGLYLLLFSSIGASVAFADVASKLKDARTLTFTISTSTPTIPAISIKNYIGASGASRTEVADDAVSIHKDRQTLMLFPKSKVATRIEVTGEAVAGSPSASTTIEGLRHLGDMKATPVGEKTIDGVAVQGFTVTYGGVLSTVWADAKTAVPVRIEQAGSIGAEKSMVVMSDFKLDVPLDDSLFSMDVPAGYTLKTQAIDVASIARPGHLEDEVAKLLGRFSELADGRFPDELTDWVAYFKAAEHMDDDARGKFSAQVGGVSGMLFSLPNGYVYAGKGVHNGDKAAVVFWAKPAAGITTVKAVYGDLRVADVPVKALPTTQPVH